MIYFWVQKNSFRLKKDEGAVRGTTFIRAQIKSVHLNKSNGFKPVFAT